MMFFNFRAIVAVVLCLVVLAFSVPVVQKRNVFLGEDILTALEELIAQVANLLQLAQSAQGNGFLQLNVSTRAGTEYLPNG